MFELFDKIWVMFREVDRRLDALEKSVNADTKHSEHRPEKDE